jgi:hypothetical protein
MFPRTDGFIRPLQLFPPKKETYHEDSESDVVVGGYRTRTGYGDECAGGLLRIRGLLCLLFRLREVKAR